MKNITITTTNHIEDAHIDKYMGIITTNIVVGTNLFSDIAASFTDFFGGNSETYQRKLQLIYKDAINDLSLKALAMRANCILGLHIDFDEISGKNKSMFMVSLIGTAVKINIESKEIQEESIDTVSSDFLINECFKRRFIKKFEEEYPNEAEWEYILSHDMPELAELLYRVYIKSYSTYEYEAQKLAKQNFPSYLNRLDYQQATAIVYSDVENSFDASFDLIYNFNLFNAEAILQLIKKNKIKIAISLLNANKPTYTKEDLLAMKSLSEVLNNLPNLGSVEMIKGGLLSKDSEKYICQNGHKNSCNTEYCMTCNLNIKGLMKEEVFAINYYTEKVNILEDIFQSKDNVS